jgi:hypothetical protein
MKFIITLIKTNAQKNLVPNYSFENNAVCPSNAGGRPMPTPWYFPTASIYRNSQYMNSCALDANFGVPQNVWGFQYAHSGNAYCSIGPLSLQLLNSDRYYIQANLLDSLKKGKSYYVEFFVSLMQANRYASNNISLLFTKNAIYVDTITDPFGVIQANPQITGFGNRIITDTMNWVKISGIYKAQGGEQYITIGNFKNDNQTSFTQLNSIQQYCICAAYYLDDVSVIPLDSFCLKADAGRDTTIKVGDSVFIGSYTNGIDTIKWLQNGLIPIDSTRPGFWVKPAITGTYFYVLQQTVNGCFSSDTITISVVLPLKFINYNCVSSLRGTKQSAENIWTTGNEINVSHFNVQHSVNGKDFINMGKVTAKNSILNEYNFIDEKPNVGINYYRVVSVDKDGKLNYTVIKSLNVNHSSLNVITYPNPANDFVTIQGNNIKQIKIINQLGQTIQQLNNITQHQTINTKQFTKGIYIVQVTTTKGETSTQKLIIN